MIRVGVLGSTRGSHLTAIVDAIRNKQLAASIEIVVSNKSTSGILQLASSYHLTSTFVDPANLEREDYDEQISLLLKQQKIDVIVLMGYMRILSAKFVSQWRDKILNVHPSLLPNYAGLMDMDVHHAVLAAGDHESGCTVHVVTEEVDAGPILVQKKCPILPGDTAEILKKRVQALESPALIEAICRYTNGSLC